MVTTYKQILVLWDLNYESKVGVVLMDLGKW